MLHILYCKGVYALVTYNEEVQSFRGDVFFPHHRKGDCFTGPTEAILHEQMVEYYSDTPFTFLFPKVLISLAVFIGIILVTNVLGLIDGFYEVIIPILAVLLAAGCVFFAICLLGILIFALHFRKKSPPERK